MVCADTPDGQREVMDSLWTAFCDFTGKLESELTSEDYDQLDHLPGGWKLDLDDAVIEVDRHFVFGIDRKDTP